MILNVVLPSVFNVLSFDSTSECVRKAFAVSLSSFGTALNLMNCGWLLLLLVDRAMKKKAVVPYHSLDVLILLILIRYMQHLLHRACYPVSFLNFILSLILCIFCTAVMQSCSLHPAENASPLR